MLISGREAFWLTVPLLVLLQTIAGFAAARAWSGATAFETGLFLAGIG